MTSVSRIARAGSRVFSAGAAARGRGTAAGGEHIIASILQLMVYIFQGGKLIVCGSGAQHVCSMHAHAAVLPPSAHLRSAVIICVNILQAITDQIVIH